MEVKASSHNGSTAIIRAFLANGAWHMKTALMDALRPHIRPEEAYRIGRQRFKNPDDLPHFQVVDAGFAVLVGNATRRLGCEIKGVRGQYQYRLPKPAHQKVSEGPQPAHIDDQGSVLDVREVERVPRPPKNASQVAGVAFALLLDALADWWREVNGR